MIKKATQSVSATVTSLDAPTLTNQAPSAPASGVKIYAKDFAKPILTYRAAGSAYETRVQTLLSSMTMYVRPAGWGSSSISQIGTTGAPTAYDSAAAGAAFASTNYRTQTRRVAYASGTGANASAGFRTAGACWRGDAAGVGGFFASVRFAFSALPATRWASGLCSANFTGAAEPSASVTWIGVGQDSTDATIQFMHNDAAGASTKSDTGLATPTTADVYELNFYCPSNSSTIDVTLQNLNGGGSIIAYTASTELPAAATLFQVHTWASNMATGIAASVDLVAIYVETNN
jgi:hypothetical protein